ncbi:hypothetical protein [Polaromonas sp. YR568]|uniref:hypothetical protein n=1 Tax=Polaromonas sp. YR568 TaxID=1855301 RepID=UPI00398BDF09
MAAQLSQNASSNFDLVAAKVRGLISQLPRKLSVVHTTIQAMKLAGDPMHGSHEKIYWPDVMDALQELTPGVPQVEAQLEAILNDLMALREEVKQAKARYAKNQIN